MKVEIKSSFILAVVMLFALLLGAAPAGAQDKGLKGLRVLFLGDRAGHKPADRFAIIQPVLAKKNIEVTYTESMADINPTNLAGYDCLMIYANTTRITPEQETAMLDFVAAGGGLVPIHCASYCFLNSPKYIELVGGQFKTHQTGVFKETVVKSDHPIMKGLSPIESWDETYVHTKNNTNRIVLAERHFAGTNSVVANLGNTEEPGGAEPYTWVRDHGKGRVFYTAWGHDQRTWGNADFQALLENGVRWSVENSPNLAKRRAESK